MGDGAIIAIFLAMFFALVGWWNAIKGIVVITLIGGVLLLLAIMARPSNKDPPAPTGGNM